MAKAKQKSVPKESTHEKAERAGERLYIDLSKIKKPDQLKSMGKPNWFMIVDKKTNLKTSSFYKTKASIVDYICVLLNK